MPRKILIRGGSSCFEKIHSNSYSISKYFFKTRSSMAEISGTASFTRTAPSGQQVLAGSGSSVADSARSAEATQEVRYVSTPEGQDAISALAARLAESTTAGPIRISAHIVRRTSRPKVPGDGRDLHHRIGGR